MKPKYDITKLENALQFLVKSRDKKTNLHAGICSRLQNSQLYNMSGEVELFKEIFEPKNYNVYYFGDPHKGRKDHLLIRYKKRVKAMKALIKEAERRNAL